jgi:hypothetical protein
VFIVTSFAVLFILVKFLINREIELMWKLILTSVMLLFRFGFSGLTSIIGTVIPVIGMYLMLRWHGSDIR